MCWGLLSLNRRLSGFYFRIKLQLLDLVERDYGFWFQDSGFWIWDIGVEWDVVWGIQEDILVLQIDIFAI